MRNRAADDADEITKRIAELRRERPNYAGEHNYDPSTGICKRCRAGRQSFKALQPCAPQHVEEVSYEYNG